MAKKTKEKDYSPTPYSIGKSRGGTTELLYDNETIANVPDRIISSVLELVNEAYLNGCKNSHISKGVEVKEEKSPPRKIIQHIQDYQDDNSLGFAHLTKK